MNSLNERFKISILYYIFISEYLFIKLLYFHRPPWLGKIKQILKNKKLINYPRYKSCFQGTWMFWDIINIYSMRIYLIKKLNLYH